MKDLAAHGQTVTLRVQVSRWWCRNPRCETVIFAERLPGVVVLLARFVGILRADDGFCRDFDARLDEMLAEHGIWIRQEDGSLAAPSNAHQLSGWQLASP